MLNVISETTILCCHKYLRIAYLMECSAPEINPLLSTINFTKCFKDKYKHTVLSGEG